MLCRPNGDAELGEGIMGPGRRDGARRGCVRARGAGGRSHAGVEVRGERTGSGAERRGPGRRRGAGACPGGNGAWQARRVPAGLQWGGGRGRDSRLSPQAKYLAQIILVGAQVVGRAFMRALRQELAGRS